MKKVRITKQHINDSPYIAVGKVYEPIDVYDDLDILVINDNGDYELVVNGHYTFKLNTSIQDRINRPKGRPSKLPVANKYQAAWEFE
jgi:hypothetical protein